MNKQVNEDRVSKVQEGKKCQCYKETKEDENGK